MLVHSPATRRARLMAYGVAALAVCAAATPAPSAAQAPACQLGSLAAYRALGTTGCTVGGALTFSDFSSMLFGNLPGSLAGISLAPIVSAIPDGRMGYGFDFFLGTLGDVTAADPGGLEGTAVLGALATPVGGTHGVSGVVVALINGLTTPAGPGGRASYGGTGQFGTGSETITAYQRCNATGAAPETCTTFDQFFSVVTRPTRVSLQGSVNTLGTGTRAALSSTRILYIITPASSVVPEPSTYALFGFGLAALGIVARQRTRTV